MNVSGRFESAPGAARAPKVSILLAEDNDDDILIIREAFNSTRMAGLETVVKDGEETLLYLRRVAPYSDAPTPGLVLLDINMPRKDGIEVLREMKLDDNLRHIPVVMLTTSNRREDVSRAYFEGASGFITKPARFSDFRKIMKQFALYWGLVSSLPLPHKPNGHG